VPAQPPPCTRAAALHLPDADIEAILTKGERDTKDLNEKMNKFSENAKAFTMDGGLSLYDFKDEVCVGATQQDYEAE
jgi:phosphoribosylaminoimidazole-succinocarboxamide synthase